MTATLIASNPTKAKFTSHFEFSGSGYKIGESSKFEDCFITISYPVSCLITACAEDLRVVICGFDGVKLPKSFS